MINLNHIDSSLPKDINISGIQDNSKKVRKGDLFVAINGSKENGVHFINEAIKLGASAILTSEKILETSDIKIPVIINDSPRKKLSEISKLFFPNSPPIICGVTGTNGKTSTVDFLYQIWSFLDINAARIGTLGVKSSDINFKTENTTPGPIELHKLINDLSLSGVSHLALEVSSHGIQQSRVDSIDFNSACFTNLSLDHLDYHETFGEYLKVKFKLFEEILSSDKPSVICVDNEYGSYFSKKLKLLNKKVLDIGEGAEFINITSVERLKEGIKVSIIYQKESFSFSLNVRAYFQILNILSAAGLAIASGCNYNEVFSVLEKLKPAQGRLEPISKNNHSNIIIDYAHTPEALSCTLRSIEREDKGKLIIIFGCGGDRDQSKRSIMGQVAQEYCDEIIITNDNPRSEDPLSIANAILKGCPEATLILDRTKAIEFTLSRMKSQDILLIAGKVHEETQIIGNTHTPFSDRKTVENFLEASYE